MFQDPIPRKSGRPGKNGDRTWSPSTGIPLGVPETERRNQTELIIDANGQHQAGNGEENKKYGRDTR